MAPRSGAAPAPASPSLGRDVRASGSRARAWRWGPLGPRRRRQRRRRSRWRGSERPVPPNPRRPRGGLRGQSPAAAKFGASGAALRGEPVPPRAVPSAGSVPPPSLPGQDKGSLTRDGTAPHKWDRSATEPERRRASGGRGWGRASWGRRRAPGPAETGASGRTREEPGEGARLGVEGGLQSRCLSLAGAAGWAHQRAGSTDRLTS